jgi:hypothetical protein
MAHKRQAIREAIVAILNGVPALTGKVFANRARPTEINELPVALVYTVAEESDLANIGVGLSRTLTVAIELRAKAVGALDDVLDGLCELVEASMSAEPTLGQLAFLSFLRSTAIGIDGEGEARQALATLNYELRYETDPAGI